MKQILITDEIGTPLYYDREDGQMLCPLICVFQQVVFSDFGQYARSVTTLGRTQIALQVHGRLHFLAVSDQGEPAAELDSELFLVHDLLAATVGPAKLEVGSSPASASAASSRITWSSKRQHDGFLRLVDTALALCSAYPSVLVRALEQLEVNDDIRAMCAAKLREVLAELPELRGAALFVGTRVLAQCSGAGMGGTGTGGGPGVQSPAQLAPQDVLTLMLHVHSLFRPAVRSTDASRPQPSSSPKQPDPSAAPGTAAPSAAEVPGAQQGPPASVNSTPALQPVSPSLPVLHRSSPTPRASSAAVSVAVGSQSPVGYVGSPMRSRMVARILSTSPTAAAFGRHGRRKSGTPGPPAPPPIAEATVNVEGGLCASSWLPADLAPSANVGVLHLGAGGLPHVVYAAELLPGIFLAVALRENPKRIPDQRNVLAYAHMTLRDWLSQDYAPFLLTKERAHMPMLSYVAQVPGVVHFIFVDRLRHMAIVPSVSPLYGQDSNPQRQAHTASSLRRLVWRLVQHAHSHLARGCTTMMLRCGGFHFSYRLWLEGENEDPPALEKIISPKLPQPWIVSPQLYADLINYYKATRCYELYSIYVGAVPITAVAKKDRQLLLAMASLTGQAFGF